jgi:hypothetical protein
MQYSLLADVWAPPKKAALFQDDARKFDTWQSKECERTKPRRELAYDTAARRITVPGTRQALPDCQPKPVGEPSNLRNLLSTIYNEQGPDVFVSLLPKPFVQDLTKTSPQCAPAGNMYTRQGLFKEPEDPFARDEVTEVYRQRPETHARVPMYTRPHTYYSHDDQAINIVLYAVTLGLIALVIIDTIMRFKR